MTRTPTFRATITPQYRNAPIAHPRATRAGTPQPRPYIAPIWLTFTTRRIASSTEVLAAWNRPSDNASTTVMATEVKAMAQKLNRTPVMVPITACARARSSRRQAADINWIQNVPTVKTSPMGKSNS